jgi:hypothetical protein
MPFTVIELFIVHDKTIVLTGTWRTTRKNSATTRVIWDALGWLNRKKVEDYLTRKGKGGRGVIGIGTFSGWSYRDDFLDGEFLYRYSQKP